MNARGNQSPESVVRDIRRDTRRKYSTEEKIRIVLEGLKVEVSIAELCRREGIVSNLYYRWSKDFLEAGKKRLAGDTVREVPSSELDYPNQFSFAMSIKQFLRVTKIRKFQGVCH